MGLKSSRILYRDNKSFHVSQICSFPGFISYIKWVLVWHISLRIFLGYLGEMQMFQNVFISWSPLHDTHFFLEANRKNNNVIVKVCGWLIFTSWSLVRKRKKTACLISVSSTVYQHLAQCRYMLEIFSYLRWEKGFYGKRTDTAKQMRSEIKNTYLALILWSIGLEAAKHTNVCVSVCLCVLVRVL